MNYWGATPSDRFLILFRIASFQISLEHASFSQCHDFTICQGFLCGNISAHIRFMNGAVTAHIRRHALNLAKRIEIRKTLSDAKHAAYGGALCKQISTSYYLKSFSYERVQNGKIPTIHEVKPCMKDLCKTNFLKWRIRKGRNVSCVPLTLKTNNTNGRNLKII